jgi:4-hydroxyphenylpyruvate dioxygenase
MINCLHHFEILTNSSEKLLNYFIKGFKFNLVNKINLDNRYTQYLVNSNSINFLITSLETDKNENTFKYMKNIDSNYKSSLLAIEEFDKNLYKVIKSKNNTAFNVSFKVRDLDRILFNCRKNNVKIIKDRHSIQENVDCAIIRSCVDGVAHTLFDLNNYKGEFLFDSTDSKINKIKQNNLATHFDHLTYATYKNTSKDLIQWYMNIFNMKNIRINKEENSGLIVRTGKSGMNIRAMKYWLCAETGVESKEPINDHQNFKLVISEPLEDDPFNNESAKNQISIFLDENNGPGVQHIGFHTDNIINSVRETKTNCNQVEYYVTPDSYYENVKRMILFSSNLIIILIIIYLF